MSKPPSPSVEQGATAIPPVADVVTQPNAVSRTESKPVYAAWVGNSGITTTHRGEAIRLAREWAASGEESYVEETIVVTTCRRIWPQEKGGGS